MQFINADDIETRLSYPGLIDVLDAGFRDGAISPLRHHHDILRAERPEITLLLMPAWTVGRSTGDAGDGGDARPQMAGDYAGVKLVTVTPDNGAVNGLPAISGLYLLLSTDTGQPVALIDGTRLTVWRTAAASGLAARCLAREDAEDLLIVGAGALAPYLARAHSSVRPIRRISIWNRTMANADAVAAKLGATGLGAEISVADDLEAAVRRADIVSTATISSTPVVHGAWLKPGAHVDCVGAFKPTMRETDDDVVRRASIWVDTMTGGLKEAGDIVMPLAAGIISEADIQGDLFALARGTAKRRTSADEITMFKSVGASIEDLFAAIAVYKAGDGG